MFGLSIRVFRRVVPKVLFLALICALIGGWSPGSRQPTVQTAVNGDAERGVILIDLAESGLRNRYWQYEVRPGIGSIRMVKEQILRGGVHADMPHDSLQPTGAGVDCGKRTEAISHDGEYAAYCTNSHPDELFAVDRQTHETVYHWKPEKWRAIHGFGWAPKSPWVAFLNESSYYGKNPLELLAGLSGHPVPHDTIFLNVVDVRARKMTEYEVRRNVLYSFSRILNWSE
jgi:hypothetical protein